MKLQDMKMQDVKGKRVTVLSTHKNCLFVGFTFCNCPPSLVAATIQLYIATIIVSRVEKTTHANCVVLL